VRIRIESGFLRRGRRRGASYHAGFDVAEKRRPRRRQAIAAPQVVDVMPEENDRLRELSAF
jgi:hypothetical protein